MVYCHLKVLQTVGRVSLCHGSKYLPVSRFYFYLIDRFSRHFWRSHVHLAMLSHKHMYIPSMYCSHNVVLPCWICVLGLWFALGWPYQHNGIDTWRSVCLSSHHTVGGLIWWVARGIYLLNGDVDMLRQVCHIQIEPREYWLTD